MGFAECKLCERMKNDFLAKNFKNLFTFAL